MYDRALGFLQVPTRHPERRHVFHLYQVVVERRDELMKFLVDKGVEAKVHYPVPLHRQPAAAMWKYAKGSFPKTESQSERAITLPCHQFLAEEQIDYVISSLKEFYGV